MTMFSIYIIFLVDDVKNDSGNNMKKKIIYFKNDILNIIDKYRDILF